MATSKRVDLSLLDDNLKSLINASAKIFPITQNDIDTNNNTNGYEYGKLYVDTDKKTYLYRWQDTQWVMMGADDKSVDWNNDVKDKPTTYPPSTHTHDYASTNHTHTKSNITDFPTIPTDTNQLTKTDVYTKAETDNKLNSKSDSTHNHDGRYATPSQLATKADSTHNHDGVYQPKGNYAADNHNHDTQYATKSIESTVSANTSDISNIKANLTNGDVHSNISILNQLTQVLIDAWNSAVSHISDAVKHITSAERTLWNTVSSKANETHTHNATDITENTSKRFVTDTDKSNWNGKVDTSTFNGHTGNATSHVTQTEKDTWNGKANGTHTHTKSNISDFAHSHTKNEITDLPTIPSKTSQLTNDSGFINDISGKSDVGHTHTKSNITDFSHTHNASTDITEDASHRFATDTQISTWNAKQKAITASTTQPTSPALYDLWVDLN